MYYNWLYSPDCTGIRYDRHLVHVYHDRYPIVYMIWFGHLTLVLTALIIVHLCLACYYSFISVHIFIILFMILIISSFIHSLSCCTNCLLCTSTFLFLTHSLGRFLATLNLHVQILDILFFDQVSLRLYMLWGAGVSTYSDIIVFLYPCYYSLIPVYQTCFYSTSYPIWDHV